VVAVVAMDKAGVIVMATNIKTVDNAMTNSTTTMAIAIEVVDEEVNSTMMMITTTTVRLDMVVVAIVAMVIIDNTTMATIDLLTHTELMDSQTLTIQDLMHHQQVVCKPLTNSCKLSFYLQLSKCHF